MTGLPDPDGTRVLLVGAASFTSLDGLPAVAANLTLLRELFTKAWDLPASHVTLLPDPSLPRDMSRAVQEAVDAATDTLLVYYAGHGLIEPRTGKLHLATETTDPASVHDTATPYDWIRWPVEKSRAARRIVVLDCCYSARAFGAQSSAASLEVDGTYLLAAAAETAVALSPPGEPLTAFTGEWLTVMREGVPGEEEYLDLDTIFTRLRTRLVTRDRPEPHRLCRNQLGLSPFIRNAARTPPTVPPSAADDTVGRARSARASRADRSVADIYTARSLADTLQAIADGAVAGFGYELAALNLVRPDGDLVVAAFAGSPAAEALITGRVGSRESWEHRLSMGTEQSGLHFIPHTEGWVLLDDDVPQWYTEDVAPDDDGAWHPEDRLYAPMYAPDGDLVGVLSVDRPFDGRRPDLEGSEALQRFAYHSAIAIGNARLRANMQRALVRLEREQQALRASEESFRQTFEYAPVGMAIAELGGDRHGRILRCNDALCRLLGRPASAMRRYSFSDLVHPEDIATLMKTSAEGGRAELRLCRRDGTYVWVGLRNSVVADATDGPRFLLTHVDDIDARKSVEGELLRRACRDELTGLLTESELRERLDKRLCDRADPVRRPSPDTDSDGLLTDPVHGKPHRCAGPPTGDNPTVAVLRFGLDGFKAYNARHTRAAGDAVLREVANRLRTVLDEWGDGGEIARVRGDEFVVLAPGADEPGAGSLAARLHSVCRWPARGRAAFGGWTLGATGVTTWAVCGRSAEQVLRASGELLHHRKAQ